MPADLGVSRESSPEVQGQPPLDYGCTYWRSSSQSAANVYNEGVKLWTKEDLRDIEEQLEHAGSRSVFTVRSIDGTTISIKNPFFGEENPIWKPHVKFQQYWRLVKERPDGPQETYHCSYLVDWGNISEVDFRDKIKDLRSVFEETRQCWLKSPNCVLLQAELDPIIRQKKVSKVVCFGLGDICRYPPEWHQRFLATSEPDHKEITYVRGSMIQHAIALTIAEACRTVSSEEDEVKLLAQDPAYTQEAEDILTDHGFSIVGRFGAGGFAEVDDETIVFSAFVAAPLKQIIADLARPAVVICTGSDTFNDHS